MDQLVEIWNAIWEWFGDKENRERAVAITAVVALAFTFIGGVWYVLTRIVPRRKKASIEGETNPSGMPVAQFDPDAIIDKWEQRRANLISELETAHAEEKDQLRARISELERLLANPDAALKEAQDRIAQLETLLDRSGNTIGGDRIAKARAALETGDYSEADDIFAEIEARKELDIQEAARAAFGRGEIAEAEVRWADAATHYARAARLDPTYDALYNATEYSQLAGDYDTALHHSTQLVEVARTDSDQRRLSRALDRHATIFWRKGDNTKAESLFREALDIDRATCGETHSDFAEHLNNLAATVRAQGRFVEAETLFRQALDVSRATFGQKHSETAKNINNLALVVSDQGRFEEAEALFKQALDIDRATIGEDHPDFANHLNNLAGVVAAQGRLDEAEALYTQALAIAEARLGAEHPSTLAIRANLEGLLATKPDG